jgi:hypothetical protein
MIAGVQVEISTEHLPNTALEPYRWNTEFGETFLSAFFFLFNLDGLGCLACSHLFLKL